MPELAEIKVETIIAALTVWLVFFFVRNASFSILGGYLGKKVPGSEFELLRMGSDFTFLGAGIYVGLFVKLGSILQTYNVSDYTFNPFTVFAVYIALYFINYYIALYLREHNLSIRSIVNGNIKIKLSYFSSLLFGFLALVLPIFITSIGATTA